jgi:hypothetical protein
MPFVVRSFPPTFETLTRLAVQKRKMLDRSLMRMYTKPAFDITHVWPT